jgi:hypothetical protein
MRSHRNMAVIALVTALVACGMEGKWDKDGDAHEDVPRDEPGDETIPDGTWDPTPDPDLDGPLDPTGDPGVDAPIDPLPDPVDGDSPPACTGAPVGGFCWYLGAPATGCNTTCSARGGYNDGTRTYAGSDGTNENCDAVFDALGVPGPGTTILLPGSGQGLGCTCHLGDRYRVEDTPTTEVALAPNQRRACACLF